MSKKAKSAKKTARKLLKPKLLRKMPKFKRSDSWKYVRVKERWRTARGIDSKMRLERKGYLKSPNAGYGTPRKYRGLHPSGLREVLVFNPEALKNIAPDKQAVRVAHTVGAKKRNEIFEKAKKLKLLVLNPRGIKTIEPEKSTPPSS